MSYVETILDPDERITYRAYLHWIIVVRGLVAMFLGFSLFVGAVMHDTINSPIIGSLGLILIVFGIVDSPIGMIRRWTTEIAVTDRRVIVKRGLIMRTTVEINMPKVESVDVRQSVIGRLLDYGAVIVRGTGGSPNILGPTVSNPLLLRRSVRKQPPLPA